MYRHSHSTLGLAALAGGALHAGGVDLVFATVLAGTAAAALVSVGHIAFALGLPQPHQLLAACRRRR